MTAIDSLSRFDYPATMHGLRPQLLLTSLAAVALLAAAGCTPKYPKCEKDSHCEAKGEVCVEGTCQQCRADDNCEAGQMCKGGACVAKPECASNGDCAGNKICRSGKCQLECSGAGDCGSGLKCMNNRCVDELSCNATSDCNPGMTCKSGRCTEASSMVSMDRCAYPTVRFDFNEANLSSGARNGLGEVVECLKQKGGTIIIEGHCDERGTEEYNLALGDRRARAVKRYLENLGVSGSKLRVVSKGEADPVNTASNEDAWAENRRAEFIEQ